MADLTSRMVAANQRRALGIQGSYAVETVTPEEERAAPAEPAVGGVPPAEAASYLKRDGSRSLSGNLPVDAGVTVDGVDISVHAANVNAHHAKVHALSHQDGGNDEIDLTGLSGTEIRLVPKPASTGPEGTIFYDSDDNHVYVATE